MYRVAAYTLKKKFLGESFFDEYPTGQVLETWMDNFKQDCFVDICRIPANPFEHLLALSDGLEYDLVTEEMINEFE
jgi:hypothetical protein